MSSLILQSATTVKELDSTIKMRAAYLRLGRENLHIVQSSNHIRVPIISNEGELGEFGVDPTWKRCYKHPDTGVSFNKKVIPNFPKAVKACIDLHKKLPHFSIIGWDVSITEEGEVKIMEWNAGHPDIKFSEAATGPCFIGLNWENIHKKLSKS